MSSYSTVPRALFIRWSWYLFAAVSACTVIWTFYALSEYRSLKAITRPLASSSSPSKAAGNATLGFQAILALSPSPSWRTAGLQAAAKFTGLQIQIPPQPPLHSEIVDAFAGLGSEDVRHPNHGSSLAWLAHLDLIKYVVASDMESALIIEDDVDWDLSIREQTVGIADAVRKLTNTSASDAAPYGQSWDVLWVGLCAETWDQNFETVFVDDPTACPADLYRGLAKGPVDRLPPSQRAVFHSGAPICTFAYGLSRDGARMVLQDVGAGKDEAFDIALMNGCRERNLTCISVLPEIFRHYVPPPSFGGSSLVNSKDEDNNTVRIETEMGSTENILRSARCHALWGKDCLPR
ncbi:hypothetical protein BDV25DRAFT_136543 [Aspergillus avenaceus]|uniref:Glycosyltransferase family 25 protein n=1 Tax=Aspergillus avenaceus TaxID=36643 RepID=A0A5N6U578_ASPAV|nr:hypothetical protein BDV25DRAFT_136543 [Aspergillus avenaceus]